MQQKYFAMNVYTYQQHDYGWVGLRSAQNGCSEGMRRGFSLTPVYLCDIASVNVSILCRPSVLLVCSRLEIDMVFVCFVIAESFGIVLDDGREYTA